MALNINGTTGISGVDGSASAPAVQGTDSNTGVSFGADTVNINTGGQTRATVDSSGNVGIKTSSPIGTLDVHDGTFVLSKPSSNSSSRNWRFLPDNAAAGNLGLQVSTAAGGSTFSNVVEINSAGKMMLATTSVIQGSMLSIVSGDGVRVVALENGGTGTNDSILFRNANGDVGAIKTSGSSTAYNTSSDYRLKENVVAISDGITRLKTLKPSRFNFIADAETTVDGFLAHEVTAVPEAITGTKDEVDSDNNPVYQGIDQSKLVPLLTAALQEAIAKIEVLETKVAALEAG